MKNITDTMERLYIKAEKYSSTSLELLKLNAIDKTADVIASLALLLCLFMVFAMFTLFITVGIGLLLGKLLNSYALGFFCISGFYIVLGFTLYQFRHKFIKDPVSGLIIRKLLRKNAKTDYTATN